MNKTLLSLLALVLLPTALAHFPPGTSNPECNPAQNPHDYWTGVDPGVVTVSDGCRAGGDGDAEYGVRGAFLPASHHTDTVCVEDLLLDDPAFAIGADGNGDGMITANAPDSLVTGSGCVKAGGPAGADGGWWVFLTGPATVGHVTTP